MLHDRVVTQFDLEDVARRWAYGRITSQQLPALARDALDAGLDAPALLELAWLDRPTMAEAGPLFRRALDELGQCSATIEEQPLRFAIELARRILAGEVGILAGCSELTLICRRGGLEADPLFRPFVGVDSSHDFPAGEVRARWSDDALREVDRDRARAEAEHREFVEAACRALIARSTT